MKSFFTIFMGLFLSLAAWAQTPQSFNYQAVVRDDAGNVMASEDVTIQVAILQGSAAGPEVYSETFDTTTNDHGLVNLQIGSTANLEDITWSADDYYLEISVDGQVMGTSQLLSVPYALHAETAAHAETSDDSFSGDFQDLDNLPDFHQVAMTGSYDDLLNLPDLDIYLTEETDPLFTGSAAYGIEDDDIDNWDNAFSWGDHGVEGYALEDDLHAVAMSGDYDDLLNIPDLDIFVTEESDPLFSASAAADIDSTDIDNWDEAFSWGDHGDAGYAQEEDLHEVASSGDYYDLENRPEGLSKGDILYWDGDQWEILAAGMSGQFLQMHEGDLRWIDINVDEITYTVTFDVSDEEGAAINNAVITLGDMENEAGNYVFEDVAGGYYDYSITMDGFTDVYEENLEVTEDLTVNVTMESSSITDVDGNVYETVEIGDQLWMAENLRTTKYRDGSSIAGGLPNDAWSNATQGAYAIYPHGEATGIDSEDEMVNAYGKIYNWLAVDDDRGLCPEGWRVPTQDELGDLINYVGNDGHDGEEGLALRSCRQENSPLGDECDTSEHPRWDEDDTYYGIDAYGFNALPAGARHENGSFEGIGQVGHWWSTTDLIGQFARGRRIYHDNDGITMFMVEIEWGFSVRCIQDDQE